MYQNLVVVCSEHNFQSINAHYMCLWNIQVSAFHILYIRMKLDNNNSWKYSEVPHIQKTKVYYPQSYGEILIF